MCAVRVCLCVLCVPGGGEFGEVYKAKWHGSYVAAKVLKRSDEIALGDFRTEIAILRKIHHPNCVQVGLAVAP
jgi:serine/threonine protein kinase